MIRPWHKSPLFYLGLAPLLFILWAWLDSNHRSTNLIKIGGTTSLIQLQVIRHSCGSILISDQKVELLHATFSSGTEFGRTSVTREERAWFPAARIEIARQTTSETADYQREITTESRLILPHWTILTIYLALWALAFLWRSRRRKRLSRLKISA